MYIYKLYKEKDYSHYVTSFYEAWTKVGEVPTFEEAIEMASRLAFEDDTPGSRLVYREARRPGGYFNFVTLGGVIIDVPPLPHAELEYVVIDEDKGESLKKFYTADDIED